MKTGKEMDDLISQKLKRSKGITIIALVVTIIVLIILAGVSISIVLREGGVLREVEISKDLTERKNTIELAQLDIAGEQTDNKGQLTEEKFKDILAKYFNYDPKSKLPEDLSTLVLTTKDGKYNDILASEIYSGKFSKNTNSKTAENIKEARKLVDSNTEITSDDDVKVTIPAGFTIPEDSPTNAKEGIIVTDSINESTGKSNGSEFVWIPVNSNLTVVGTKKAMAKESKAEGYEGKDGKTNYEGVLYDFEGTKSTEKSSYGQGTNEYREPDIVNWYDCSEEYLNMVAEILNEQSGKYKDEESFKVAMQDDYNEMIESVKKYGGFYVGRYEMGLEDRKAISKAGPVTTANNWDLSCRWYGLYARGKTYTNARNSVKSSMIWGSQYDAMLNYALTGDDKDKVTSTGNGNNGGSEMNTGSTPKDKILNIFDLAGNHSEWTSEVYTEMYRTYRGGNYTRVCSPATRVTEEAPDNVGNTFSTRIALYICNNK